MTSNDMGLKAAETLAQCLCLTRAELSDALKHALALRQWHGALVTNEARNLVGEIAKPVASD